MKLLGIMPNKTICVFRETGLEIIGRDTYLFFSGKNIILCILKGISKCIKYFFSRESDKKSWFDQ